MTRVGDRVALLGEQMRRVVLVPPMVVGARPKLDPVVERMVANGHITAKEAWSDALANPLRGRDCKAT